MNLIEKYAKLITNTAVNVQKNETLIINCPTHAVEFGRLLTKYAYESGARKVITEYYDLYTNKINTSNRSTQTLKEKPTYLIEKYKYYVDKSASIISVSSPIPGINSDIDPKKIKLSNETNIELGSDYREKRMTNEVSWTICAYPNYEWAKIVYPDLDKQAAYDKLLKNILAVSRITNNPEEEWNKHKINLAKQNKLLNDHNFKKLVFKNKLGTDLTVGLVDDHIWKGGTSKNIKGHEFLANIPTEETYTMPHNKKTNGIVYSSMPLLYNGQIIDEFYLEFKDGLVINYDAKIGLEPLKELLNADDGTKRIGEVALVPHNSPISKLNTLFQFTLLDENASCHLALGDAYPNNIKNGIKMGEEELKKLGYNASSYHVDFMFGTEDITVTGIKHNNEEVIIMKDGDLIYD